MIEFLNYTIAPVNIIPTALMMLVLVYWITVFIGLLDLHFLDIHIDLDKDFDSDIDSNGHIAHGHSSGFLSEFLSFFNLGKVPFTIFLSVFSLALWVMALLANYYFNITRFGESVLLLFPIVFISLLITKFATEPLAGVFQKIDESAKIDESFIGTTGKVVISISKGTFGQIEVERNNSSIKLNAIAADDSELKLNQSVIITDYISEKDYYVVEEYKIL
jgi:hypothetical protein